MKRKAVDYRKLRWHNIRSEEYSHLFLLLGWVVYLGLYILTENLISPERCTPVHCQLDDRIPFCEWFIIPYVGWYFLLAGSLVYFLLYDVKSFTKLQTYLIITQIAAMAVYILFPNRQDLRPDSFERNNFLTALVGYIYAIDTSTGVCPSLHVAFSIGIASGWLRSRESPLWWKILVVIFAFLICISVSFVKQHSVIDIAAAVPVCLFAEWFVYCRKNPSQ